MLYGHSYINHRHFEPWRTLGILSRVAMHVAWLTACTKSPAEAPSPAKRLPGWHGKNHGKNHGKILGTWDFPGYSKLEVSNGKINEHYLSMGGFSLPDFFGDFWFQTVRQTYDSQFAPSYHPVSEHSDWLMIVILFYYFLGWLKRTA